MVMGLRILRATPSAVLSKTIVRAELFGDNNNLIFPPAEHIRANKIKPVIIYGLSFYNFLQHMFADAIVLAINGNQSGEESNVTFRVLASQ